MVEETNTDVSKETEKYSILMNQSKNEDDPLTHSYPGTVGEKEGGTQENTKEETDSDEGEEEEGEIETVTPDKKRAGGRKSSKEVREQNMHKEKLKGS